MSFILNKFCFFSNVVLLEARLSLLKSFFFQSFLIKAFKFYRISFLRKLNFQIYIYICKHNIYSFFLSLYTFFSGNIVFSKVCVRNFLKIIITRYFTVKYKYNFEETENEQSYNRYLLDIFFKSKEFSFDDYTQVFKSKPGLGCLGLKTLKKKKLHSMKNIFDENIFVIGDSCNFYQGTITPFYYYKSEENWLVSTGLKSDVECVDFNIPSLKDSWGEIKKEQKLLEEYIDFYKGNYNFFKRIVFKLPNFFKKINFGIKIKKQARHLLIYGIFNKMGKRSFLRDGTFLVNYNQNFAYLKNCISFFKSLETKAFINVSFYDKSRSTKFFKSFYGYKLVTHLLKSFIFYYDFLDKLDSKVVEILNEPGAYYFGYMGFLLIYKDYYKLFSKFIFKLIFSHSKKYLYLTKVKSYSKYDLKLILIFQGLLSILKNLKTLLRILNKASYLKFFFNSYMLFFRQMCIRKQFIEDEDLSGREKMKLFQKLSVLKKYDKYFLYDFYLFYISFLIEWKVSFNFVFISTILKKNWVYYSLVKSIKKEYFDLKILWRYAFFINIKDFYTFFYIFLSELFIFFKKLFYILTFCSKKVNFNTVFFLSTLYIYLFKWYNSYSFSTNKFKSILSLNNLISFSSEFLSFWYISKYLNTSFLSKSKDNSKGRLFKRCLRRTILSSKGKLNFYSKRRYLSRKKTPIKVEFFSEDFKDSFLLSSQFNETLFFKLYFFN